MKPLLIHLHLFYQDQWQMLTAKLAPALALPHELHVTMVEHNEEIEEDAKNVSPSAYVHIVPNRGFDIAPFLFVLSQVRLSKFSYIIKIHSKRNMPQGRRLGPYEIGGARWREYLLRFLERKNFERCINAFENDQSLGMVADFRLIQTTERYDLKAAKKAENILYSLQIPINVNKLHYVAGSMFMARTSIFAPLMTKEWKPADFDKHSQHHITSLAHCLERAIGYIVGGQHYEIRDTFTAHVMLKKVASRFCSIIRRLFFYVKDTNDNIRIVKILGITVHKFPIP